VRRLVVVSHAAVVGMNQELFARLQLHGWEVSVVAPRTWQNEYGTVVTRPIDGIDLLTVPVLLRGRIQRHIYRIRATRLLRRLRPDLVFVEEEPFSVPALQWSVAARRAGVPYVVRMDETLDRRLPLLARAIRRIVLPHAAGVVARAPTSRDLALRLGAVRAEYVPHPLPTWSPREPARDDTFTVGYAGRFVEQKGIRDLVEASKLLHAPVRLLLVGDGPLREELAHASRNGVQVEVITGVGHDDMAHAYARMDVLVLPSRTTATWAEQFGRVVTEALACGVPVVGSDSGEIPWLIEQTGGGVVFPEGDAGRLAGVLRELAADPARRERLAATGRESVQREFAVDAVASRLSGVLERAL
jgi:glycosyltransferase involved in cell wall biosynthesis